MLVLAAQQTPAPVDCRDQFCCELIAHDQDEVLEEKQVMLEGVKMELMVVGVDGAQVYVQPAVFVGCYQHQHLNQLVAKYLVQPGGRQRCNWCYLQLLHIAS